MSTEEEGMNHKTETWLEEQLRDPETRALFDRERASIEFAEQIEAALERGGLTRAGLAGKLGRSKAFVTQTLRRGSNLTLATMLDFANACGYELHIVLRERGAVLGPAVEAPAAAWLPPWPQAENEAFQAGVMTFPCPHQRAPPPRLTLAHNWSPAGAIAS